MTPNSYYNALPSYFGGKRELLPHVRDSLVQAVPAHIWNQLRFVDAFAGGGSVSLWAKLQGFRSIHSNDLSQRSQIVLNGLIANNHTRLTLEQFQPLLEDIYVGPGFVESAYGGSVFSQRHARTLDRVLYLIQRTHCPIHQNLLKLLLWKMTLKSVAYGTSVGTSNRGCAEALDLGNYHELNPNRLSDGSFDRLLEPTLGSLETLVQAINHGIFPATGEVHVTRQDALQLLPNLQADVVYMDPPYADTVGYGGQHEILDSVLCGNHMVEPESVFSTRVEALTDLLDSARHIPTWILSYNDKLMDHGELLALAKQVDPNRTYAITVIPYPHMAHVSNKPNNELVLLGYEGL